MRFARAAIRMPSTRSTDVPVLELHTREALASRVAADRASGRRIALVPTMGYLHEGHLSLIDLAHRNADTVVMSVFVNPLQFGPREDLDSYPRDLPHDRQLAANHGVDILFTPSTNEMYPVGEPAVLVDAPLLADRLCGFYRPGHFRGVLTVVAKLFNLVQPHIAVFGRKDFQQLVLVRRMARDLDMGVEVLGAPIFREADGLALSSRNVYLGEDEREQATLLRKALVDAQHAFEAGRRNALELREIVSRRLAAGPLVEPQYVELVSPDSLDSVELATAGDVLAIAAFVGRTRLIDNHVLGEDAR
jgi:pantoate--beta-alanine ligase